MKTFLQLTYLLAFLVLNSIGLISQVQLGSTLLGNDGDRAGSSVAISEDGQIILYGSTNANDGKGSAQVYEWNGADWTQKGSTLEGSMDGSRFGHNVSMSSNGNIVAIGAPQFDEKKGEVTVYEWSGNDWSQKGSSIVGVEGLDENGYSTALSSDGLILAVGARYHNEFTGHVRIYQWDGVDWSQIGSDIEAVAAGDYEGYSIALSSDGKRLISGAERHDGFRGQVRIFDWDGSEWSQVGNAIKGSESGDGSGWSVAISSDGNIIAIGAVVHDTWKGQVRIFQWDGVSWNQMGEDIDGISNNSDAGWSVDLSSNGLTVAVGAPFYGANVGYVSIHEWDGSNWVLSGERIEGDGNGDFAGNSCALSANGKTIVIGMYRHDHDNQTNNGQVKVYDGNMVSTTQVSNDIIKVYPSPTKGSILIKGASPSRIEVIDAQGKICQVEKSFDNMIDISHLPKGIYFIKVFLEGGVISKKVVKN